MRIIESISPLQKSLSEDPFRIVRKSIDQAIELIKSRDTIPALQVVANKDNLQEYRFRAIMEIKRRSQL
jgi:hypothetical protein